MLKNSEINNWVKRAKYGDSGAFALLYDAFSQKLFAYISLKIQNTQEAEDVLQEVFAKAFSGIKNLEVENLFFSAWIYKIASNTINDHFRKKYQTPEILDLKESFNLASKISLQRELEVASETKEVKAAFDQLPPTYKQVLELRFIEGFSLKEIAKILNKSNLSVRLIQHKALKKVRDILSKANL